MNKEQKGPSAGDAASGAKMNPASQQATASPSKSSKASPDLSVKRHRRTSQIAIIRRCFEAHPNEAITLPYLAHISGSHAVHSRIADLRRKYSMNVDGTRFE